jgi:hypothetical protein
MIRVGELVCRLTVTRRESSDEEEEPMAGALGPGGFGVQATQRLIADTHTTGTAVPYVRPPSGVDPRLIADLVYRMMRDDLRIGLERG